MQILVGHCLPLQLTALVRRSVLPVNPEHKPLLRLNNITPSVLAESAQESPKQQESLEHSGSN